MKQNKFLSKKKKYKLPSKSEAIVSICMTTEMKDEMTGAAKLQGLSMSGFVRWLFAEWRSKEADAS